MTKFGTPKFILAVLTGVLVVLNQGLGMHLPTDNIMSVAAVVVTYILSETHLEKFVAGLIHHNAVTNAHLDIIKQAVVTPPVQPATTAEPAAPTSSPTPPAQAAVATEQVQSNSVIQDTPAQ